MNEELRKKDMALEDRKAKIEFYSNEINKMNLKIMEFGELMERLMAENNRMKILMEEKDRKEGYFKRQMGE